MEYLAQSWSCDRHLIQDGNYFVAEVEFSIVGCGGWSKRKTLFGSDKAREKEDDLLDPRSDPARIRCFFVHPAWARREIGRKIMAACERAAVIESFSRFELVATLAGEPLYLARGFEVDDRFEVPLPNGAFLPVVRMSKQVLLNCP